MSVSRGCAKAMVLPAVLVVVGLLALVMAGFSYFVRSEVLGMQARRDAEQAGLAAESGFAELTYRLRTAKNDSTQWFDNPALFRHRLVWAEGYERIDDPVAQADHSREQWLESGEISPAWRYSVVAQKHDDLFEDRFRYGITPEAGKLHLNAASEAEIAALLTPILQNLELDNFLELIDALLDWRDEDDEPRPNGAESEYYNLLEPGYYPKNGPLDTIEELLLVKGFSAAVLYGEDTNRNGLLDWNEDDADETFPYYDNADGILDRGVAPFVTVWSSEPGTDSQPALGKINVNTAPLAVLAAIEGMPPEAAENIVALRAEQSAETLLEPDWVVTAGAVDPGTYGEIEDRITVAAFQFHIEILGYADHARAFRRYEWIVDMRGPLAQVLYHRDLTQLGFAWPIDDDTLVLEGQ